jgi:Flp pilus assembly protein protease CpaA
MHLLLLPILGWIAVIDARTHRISNKAVAALAVTGLATVDAQNFDVGRQLKAAMIVLVICLLLSIFCGVGMGDVKLIVVLALFLLPPELATYQRFSLVVCLFAFAYALFLSRGKFRQSVKIPLAPAIFLGTIITLIAK